MARFPNSCIDLINGCYVLRNIDKLDTLPFSEYKDRLFEKLVREGLRKYSTLTAEEQAQYDADVK